MSTKRVIFCTYSSIYSSKVLELLIADDNIDVVAIINSTRVIHPKYGFFRGAIKQIQASGFRYATYLFMVTDLFRWLQPLSKYKKSVLKTVHRLATENNIPVLDCVDINSDKAVEFIQKAKPDYLLAAHFNQLLKASVLDLPDMDFLNIHPSLLPNYKGVDPVFFALLDQNKKIGVTLHKMADTFDSGEILMQKSIVNDSNRSLFLANNQLFEEGAELALEWIGNTGLKPVNIVDNTLGQYDSWPSAEKVRYFKRMGNHLIGLSEFWNKK